MTLAILFSLKTVESLGNGLQTHSGAIALISMRTELQASLNRLYVMCALLCKNLEQIWIIQEGPADSHLSRRDISEGGLRDHLHQASASMLRQLCNDTCNSVLIENNGVVPEWGCNLFSSISIYFNENRIASVITELSQR